MDKEEARDLSIKVRDFLVERGVTVVTDDACCEALDIAPISSVAPGDIDVIIAMGGDGSILHMLHNHPDLGAPVFAVNLGGLGFMAEIPKEDVFPCLEDFLEGRYRVEERVMLHGAASGEVPPFAVNEIVVHRSPNPCLVDLAIDVDGKYFNTFAADGIIIATPTGSTAYSLAAGGPILSPELDAFVMTPIAPHTISNKPFVFRADQTIQVRHLSDGKPIEVTFDGIASFTMATGDAITVSRSERTFKLVCLDRHDFFTTLREKLNWSGKLRSR